MSPDLLRPAILGTLLLLAAWQLPRWQEGLSSLDVLSWGAIGLVFGEFLQRWLDSRKARAAALESREERRQDLEQTARELSEEREGEPQG